MHTVRILNRWFERNCQFIHRTRAGAMTRAVEGLLRGGTLTLTHVGRSMSGQAKTKHKIKCIDQLLGNAHLHRERLSIYAAKARCLLANVERPVIIVDWSDFEPGHEWLMLTAAVATKGRAVTIYEEAHRLSSYNSPGTHKRFLRRLNQVVPEHCRPYVVTDAGFRGPWFREVASLGWDFVGRVRNRIKCTPVNEDDWRYTTTLYREATTRVRHLGQWLLSHKRPYRIRLYLAKMPSRGPGRPKKLHTKTKTPKRSRKAYNEPWLLATSLYHRRGMAKEVMRLYRQRMQIEETFRDTKNTRWGFGLALARSRCRKRREVLLLLATLATWVVWLISLAAQARRWTRHYQANTERQRSVLSVVFLGREVLKRDAFPLYLSELEWAMGSLRNLILRHEVRR